MFAIRSCYQAWAPNHGPYGECTSQPQLMLLLMRQRRRRRAQDRLLAPPNPFASEGLNGTEIGTAGSGPFSTAKAAAATVPAAVATAAVVGLSCTVQRGRAG